MLRSGLAILAGLFLAQGAGASTIGVIDLAAPPSAVPVGVPLVSMAALVDPRPASGLRPGAPRPGLRPDRIPTDHSNRFPSHGCDCEDWQDLAGPAPSLWRPARFQVLGSAPGLVPVHWTGGPQDRPVSAARHLNDTVRPGGAEGLWAGGLRATPPLARAPREGGERLFPAAFTRSEPVEPALPARRGLSPALFVAGAEVCRMRTRLDTEGGLPRSGFRYVADFDWGTRPARRDARPAFAGLAPRPGLGAPGDDGLICTGPTDSDLYRFFRSGTPLPLGAEPELVLASLGGDGGEGGAEGGTPGGDTGTTGGTGGSSGGTTGGSGGGTGGGSGGGSGGGVTPTLFSGGGFTPLSGGGGGSTTGGGSTGGGTQGDPCDWLQTSCDPDPGQQDGTPGIASTPLPAAAGFLGALLALWLGAGAALRRRRPA